MSPMNYVNSIIIFTVHLRNNPFNIFMESTDSSLHTNPRNHNFEDLYSFFNACYIPGLAQHHPIDCARQSPSWEDNSVSAAKEILCLYDIRRSNRSCITKLQHHASQLNPVYIPTPYFFSYLHFVNPRDLFLLIFQSRSCMARSLTTYLSYNY